MNREEFKLEGFAELEEALIELPKATGKNVARRALIEAGEPVAEDYRSRVTRLTGRLFEGIGISAKLTPRQRRAAKREGPSSVEVYLGAGPDPAAHLEEFGSQHNAPKPMLRAAWDAGGRAILDRLGAILWGHIRKAADRQARKQARLIAKNGG